MTKRAQSPATSSGILCSNCGHYNLTPHLTCDQCGAELSIADSQIRTTRGADIPLARRRPGCITFYSLAAGAVCAPYLLIAFLSLTSGARWANIYSLSTISILLVAQVAALGLWQMKKWGWRLQMAANALAITFSAYQLLSARGDSQTLLIIVGVSAVFLFWLYRNGDLFD